VKAIPAWVFGTPEGAQKRGIACEQLMLADKIVSE
jgi:hypothetical protein